MGRVSVVCLVFGLIVGMVGCGPGGPAAEASPTPHAPAEGTSCTPPGSVGATSGGFVLLGKATVGGKSCAVLTDGSGHTLYYNKRDTATSVTCTGQCTTTWRPLHLTAGTPTGPDLPGKLTVWAGANGPQVLYNGHPLYRYSGDSVPGDATGQGKEGNWFIVTPDLKQG